MIPCRAVACSSLAPYGPRPPVQRAKAQWPLKSSVTSMLLVGSPQHTHPLVLFCLLWSLPPSLCLTLLTPTHHFIYPFCLFYPPLHLSILLTLSLVFSHLKPGWSTFVSCTTPLGVLAVSSHPESPENPSAWRALLTCTSPSTPSKGL